jgi:hypothetical protein
MRVGQLFFRRAAAGVVVCGLLQRRSAILLDQGDEIGNDWPVEKLRRNLLTQLGKQSPASADKRFKVLVATTSANPVHHGHIMMMEQAKEAVEERYPGSVVAGFIAPAHDLYVNYKWERAKKKSDAAVSTKAFTIHLTGDQRAQLVEEHLRSIHSSWLSCARWEINQDAQALPMTWQTSFGYWPDFDGTVRALCEFLNPELIQALIGEQFSDGIEVIFVCGADTYPKVKNNSLFREDGLRVVVVPRAGSELPPLDRNILVAKQQQSASQLSSTMARKTAAGLDPRVASSLEALEAKAAAQLETARVAPTTAE